MRRYCLQSRLVVVKTILLHQSCLTEDKRIKNVRVLKEATYVGVLNFSRQCVVKSEEFYVNLRTFFFACSFISSFRKDI